MMSGLIGEGYLLPSNMVLSTHCWLPHSLSPNTTTALLALPMIDEGIHMYVSFLCSVTILLLIKVFHYPTTYSDYKCVIVVVVVDIHN